MLAPSGGRIIAMTLASAALAMPQRVSGQSSGAGADTAKRVWVSVALGPSTANTRELSSGQLLGVDLSAWLTRDKLAFGIRTAAATEFLESGEVHDVAALAGIHAHNEPHVDAVVGLGVGFSHALGNAGANRRTMPVLAASAQLVFNYRFVGVGLDGFGLSDSHGATTASDLRSRSAAFVEGAKKKGPRPFVRDPVRTCEVGMNFV